MDMDSRYVYVMYMKESITSSPAMTALSILGLTEENSPELQELSTEK